MTDRQNVLNIAKDVIQHEAQAVLNLVNLLGDAFVQAVELVLECPGRVVVTGVGKSGHVGRKIAATLASTGTPAFFLHAAEGVHGDLGMITAADVVLAISHSGETGEVLALLPTIRDIGAQIIAVTSYPASRLGQAADAVLNIGVTEEADPRGVAPTSSAIAALAIGDALAMAIAGVRGFTKEDFARFHPGGSLGRQLLGDLSRSGDQAV